MKWAALIAWVVTAGGGFVLLLVVALLGFTMLAIWLQQRQGRAGAVETAAATGSAEQHFPVPVVILHGLLAATTLVLVFLTAIGVGGS